MEPAAAVRKLREYPVSFYLKFWSTDAQLVGEMMNIRPHLYHFHDRGGISIPASLALMLDDFPRERVGIEVVVERRNGDEVVEKIVPFAERERLARIIEIIQHNGRVFGDGSFDPTDGQVAMVEPFLSPTSCSAATCKAVVTSRGYLSPRIAILENQIPGPPVDVRSGNLFELLHSAAYVVERRYTLSCLCEEVPAGMAGAERTIQVGPTSVVPPMLQPVAGVREDQVAL
jgi:hypothetical protein